MSKSPEKDENSILYKAEDPEILKFITQNKNNSKVAAACRNACQVFGEDTIVDEITYRLWFCKFREGDRSCQDQARSGRPSHVGEDDVGLRGDVLIIRGDQNPTVQELVETFKLLQTTIERRLTRIPLWDSFPPRKMARMAMTVQWI
ncbi:UNVERIFIED_CONTAM: Histone-lysine N-methyltransferase SETMAR [Trichonephila clavipes]